MVTSIKNIINLNLNSSNCPIFVFQMPFFFGICNPKDNSKLWKSYFYFLYAYFHRIFGWSYLWENVEGSRVWTYMLRICCQSFSCKSKKRKKKECGIGTAKCSLWSLKLLSIISSYVHFFSKIAVATLFWVVSLSIDVWKNRVNGNCLASQILTYE